MGGVSAYIEAACRSLAEELQEAMDAHVEAFPNGDWKAVNDRLGRIRIVANLLLREAGKWPSNEIAIGNAKCLALLRDVQATPTSGSAEGRVMPSDTAKQHT